MGPRDWAWDRSCCTTVQVSLMVTGWCVNGGFAQLHSLGLFQEPLCLLCPFCTDQGPEVLLNLSIPVMQQKWGEWFCLVNFYLLIISPSFRRIYKGVTDLAISQIDTSCFSSVSQTVSLTVSQKSYFHLAGINNAVNAWEGFQKKKSGVVADCFSQCLAALHRGRTGGLKTQPKSMLDIAGCNCYEIHLSIESMLNLIIFVVLDTGIAWSKSVNDVLCL